MREELSFSKDPEEAGPERGEEQDQGEGLRPDQRGEKTGP